MKKLLYSKGSFIIMIGAWLLLLWCRTFTGLINGCSDTSIFSVIGTSVGIVVLMLIFELLILYWKIDKDTFFTDEIISETECINENIEDEESYDLDDVFRVINASNWLSNSLCIVLAIAGFCLFSMSTAEYSDWIDLFGDRTYMTIGSWDINKKYLFDVFVILVFPIWTTSIIRKLRDTGFSIGSVASAVTQTMVLSLIGFALYMKLPNIWLIEMAFLNTIALIIAVKVYAWNFIRKKRNVLAFLIGYVVFWGLLLSMFHYGGQTLTEFLTGNTYFNESLAYSYISNVKVILQNASIIGQSSVLIHNPYVLQFMMGRTNPLLTALFYGGWVPAIAVILLEIVFIVAAAAVLFRNKRKDGLDVAFMIAWLSLAIRVVAGILYSFGVPLPILLPFTGTVGIAADSMSIALILFCCLIRKIDAWLETIEGEDWDDDDWEDDEDEEDID